MKTRPHIEGPRRAAARLGMTIVELAIAMTASSVLLLGLASTLVVAFRATDSSNVNPTQLAGSAAISAIADDLRYADSFIDRSAQAIEFTVADRDANQTPEVIRYQWSGVAGDPLLRSYNGGSLVNVIPRLHDLQLSYQLRGVPFQPGSSSESDERMFIKQHETASLADYDITTVDWIGQYFLPALPVDAVTWRVTRVRFVAKTSGSTTGTWAVQLRSATLSNLPSTTVLSQVILAENKLTPGYRWREVRFAGAPQTSATSGLCLVIKHQANSISGVVQYRDWGASTPDSEYLYNDQGNESNWKKRQNDFTMQLYVFGTVSTSATPPAYGVSKVTRVGVKLRAGAQASSAVNTTVEILNAPEVNNP